MPRQSEPLPPRLGQRLLLELPAHASCLRTVRQRMRAWLTAVGWPPERTDDVVYAVSEAASNAIEHAYSHRVGAAPSRARRTVPKLRIGAAVLRAGTGGHQVEVRVRDWGRWKPEPASPGYRGRGLAIICSFCHAVTIRSDATGTEVVLLTPAVARLVPVRARPGRRAAPLRVPGVQVTAPAAAGRVVSWGVARRPLATRVAEALARAAAEQRRNAEQRRIADAVVAVARERRRAG